MKHTIQNTEVSPKVGFDKLILGMTETQITDLLGPPEAVIAEDVEGEKLLNYESLGIEVLAFDIDEGLALCNIQLGFYSEATIFGKKIFDESIETVKALIAKNGHDPICENQDGDNIITVDDLSLMLFFNDDARLESISVGVHVDDEGEFEWPDSVIAAL